MGEKVAYYALKFVEAVVNLLPNKINYYLAQGLGSVLFYLVRDRRELGVKNIQQALGYSQDQAEKLVKEVFQDLLLTAIEVLCVEGWSLADFKQRIEVEGWEHFQQAYQQEQGIIFFTGHLGNWELLGLYFSALGYPMNALAQQRGNDLITEELWRIRESLGGTVFDYRDEVKSAFKALLNNEILMILGDQDARGRGVFVDFFHQPASTPQGPVVLAQKAEAVVLPVYLVREAPQEYRLIIDPPVEVSEDASQEEQTAILQELTASLETKIRDYPEQWLWLHRRWKTEPEADA